MIAFCTLKGSAGATTTAVALTRVWPERVVLVEADPLGGAVVPGYFEGMLAAPADLLGLVNVARHGGTPEQLWQQTLAMDAVGHRLLVPGLTDPCVQGPVAAAAWPQVAGMLRVVGDRDVLVDCGRLVHQYPAVPGWVGVADGIDYQVVRQLRREVAQELSERLGQQPMNQAEQTEYARHLIRQRVLAWSDERARAGFAPPDRNQEAAMCAAVEAALFGMGRFQPLLDDDAVENIEANGCDGVQVVRREGVITRRVPAPPVADSDDELIELMQQVASRSGQRDRTFSHANPLLRLRLNDGSRLTAVAWVAHRPTVQIRRHRVADIDLGGLVALGTIDRVLAEFLRAAVRARLNLVVTGAQDAGKTTLIRALCSEIDPMERLATIEKEYELGLHRLPERHGRIVALEAREATAESDGGAITLTDLLTISLRLSLTRVIVGEVLGDEILPMLQAMSSSDGGSMCTIHGRSARDALNRMAMLCEQASPGMSLQSGYHLSAAAVDLIVHLRKVDESELPEGTIHRFVNEVVEVHSGQAENGVPATTTVFGPGADGRAVPMYRPSWLDDLQRAGFDPALLSFEAGLWGPWPGLRVNDS